MDDCDQEYPTRDEEKAFEIAMDVRDEEEERRAVAEATDGLVGDDGGCHAELIDGSYDYCGCEDCDEREAGDRDSEVGTGFMP